MTDFQKKLLKFTNKKLKNENDLNMIEDFFSFIQNEEITEISYQNDSTRDKIQEEFFIEKLKQIQEVLSIDSDDVQILFLKKLLKEQKAPKIKLLSSVEKDPAKIILDMSQNHPLISEIFKTYELNIEDYKIFNNESVENFRNFFEINTSMEVNFKTSYINLKKIKQFYQTKKLSLSEILERIKPDNYHDFIEDISNLSPEESFNTLMMHPFLMECKELVINASEHLSKNVIPSMLSSNDNYNQDFYLKLLLNTKRDDWNDIVSGQKILNESEIIQINSMIHKHFGYSFLLEIIDKSKNLNLLKRIHRCIENRQEFLKTLDEYIDVKPQFSQNFNDYFFSKNEKYKVGDLLRLKYLHECIHSKFNINDLKDIYEDCSNEKIKEITKEKKISFSNDDAGYSKLKIFFEKENNIFYSFSFNVSDIFIILKNRPDHSEKLFKNIWAKYAYYNLSQLLETDSKYLLEDPTYFQNLKLINQAYLQNFYEKYFDYLINKTPLNKNNKEIDNISFFFNYSSRFEFMKETPELYHEKIIEKSKKENFLLYFTNKDINKVDNHVFENNYFDYFENKVVFLLKMANASKKYHPQVIENLMKWKSDDKKEFYVVLDRLKDIKVKMPPMIISLDKNRKQILVNKWLNLLKEKNFQAIPDEAYQHKKVMEEVINLIDRRSLSKKELPIHVIELIDNLNEREMKKSFEKFLEISDIMYIIPEEDLNKKRVLKKI